MAIARVQTQSHTTTGVATCAVTITATSGNLLLVMGVSDGHPTAISDGVNTYTLLTSPTANGRVWYAKNITGGTLTITVTLGSSFPGAVQVLELSGAHLTSPIDQQKATASSAGTAINSGATAAAASASDYVVGLASWVSVHATPYTVSGRAFSTALSSQTDETEVDSATISGESASICISSGPIAGTNTETFTGTISGTNWSGLAAWCALIAPGSTVYTQSLSATFTPTGSRNILASKATTAALSFSGAEHRVIAKTATAALSFMGAQVRSIGRRLGGALSFSGSLGGPKTKQIALSAALTFSGTLRTTPQRFAAVLSLVGSLVAFVTRAPAPPRPAIIGPTVSASTQALPQATPDPAVVAASAQPLIQASPL